MNLPQTHYHLDNLPPIDQYFVEEAKNSVFHWPTIDYAHNKPLTYTNFKDVELSHGIPMPSPACTQQGIAMDGDRNTSKSRTIKSPSTFEETNFAKDLVKNLGSVKSLYFYNSPWSLYDWHQDSFGHTCSINFLLTDTPGARTLYKFPLDIRLNFKVDVLEYKLYRPVLFNSLIDHCVINMTDKHRYMLSVLLVDTTYSEAKKFLSGYTLNTPGYL